MIIADRKRTSTLPELVEGNTIEGAIIKGTGGEWTEEDYLPLTEQNRIIELSQGELIVPPMPTTEHQEIVLTIATAMRTYVKKHRLGKVGIAPLPVRLKAGKYREPDVMMMLKHYLHRVHAQYWEPPNLVVEVLSPGTQQTDRNEKMHEYAAAGIEEFWLVSPTKRSVEVYLLDGDAYTRDGLYSGEAVVISRILEGFTLPISEVFASEHF